MPVFRYPKGQKAEAVETRGPLAQMPSPVFLLVGFRIWTDAPATADMGALYDSGLHQRAGVAGPANGSGRHRLRETRQLFHRD